MTYPLADFKKFYLPVYITWVFLSPIFLLLANNPYDDYTFFEVITFQATGDFVLRILAFWLIFGLVWPLMIVIYPAFYQAILIKFDLNLLGLFSQTESAIAFLLWLVAFAGPIIHLVVAVYLHYRETKRGEDKELTLKEFFVNFL